MRILFLLLLATISVNLFGQGMRCPQCPPSPVGHSGEVLGTDGTFLEWVSAGGGGSVTTLSVVSANGLAGSVANPTTTPAITLSTTINSPVLAGNGTAISAATTTGTGSTVVLQGSPTLTTPNIGTPSAGVLTSCTALPLTTGLTGGNWKTIYTNGSGAVIELPLGSSGQVLTTNGASSAPTWETPSSGGWGLTGNAGTVQNTNFIGTTDNVPFEIKTNNTRRVFVNTNTNGYTAFGAGFTPTANIDIRQNQNGITQAGIRNTTSGTAATVGWSIFGVDTATQYATFSVQSPGYTTVANMRNSSRIHTGAGLSRFILEVASGDVFLSTAATTNGAVGASSNAYDPQIFIAKGRDSALTSNTSNGGFVGFGTQYPQTPVHIQRNWNGYTRLRIANTTNDAASAASLSFVLDTPITKAGGIKFTNSNYTDVAGQALSMVFDLTSAMTGGLKFESNTTPVTFSVTATNAADLVLEATTGSVGIGVAAPTAHLHIKAGTTSAAQLRFAAGVAPSSPNDGDHWYEDTNDRMMLRLNATSKEILSTSAVNSVSPTAPDRTITVVVNGTTYYIAAKTTND